jgi:phosphoribosyl 1,2-cyclic phosphodiesterase
MSLRFTVLASGSAGNASLLEADGFGLLIDAGLGPRQLAGRLAAVGASWRRVHAVLLTHTHTDHWKERTLAHLRGLNIPFYCHPGHHDTLLASSFAFPKLQDGNLARTYEADQDFALTPTLHCRALTLRHDGGATFGFRFDGAADSYGQPWSLAYLADLGSWTADLADALADVDLLALEFNHDLDLEYNSGRARCLIDRVVGDDGHLSNLQAAALLQEVLRRSGSGRPQHVVQLHLSRDCNRPHLAAAAARAVLADSAHAVGLHTACQHQPGPSLDLGVLPVKKSPTGRTPRLKSDKSRPSCAAHPWLPGFTE